MYKTPFKKQTNFGDSFLGENRDLPGEDAIEAKNSAQYPAAPEELYNLKDLDY